MRIQTSPECDKVAVALSKTQAALPKIVRNKTVKVRSGGGSYDFTYASLDNILESVKPHLAKNGLSLAQSMITLTENYHVLVTRLLHESGQWIEVEVPAKIVAPGMQPVGSAITFARRYGISAVLALVTDDDDDANSADRNTVLAKEEKGPTLKAVGPTKV